MSEIKELRAKLNLSQEELAKRLNVSRPTIQRWETGKTRTPTHAIELLKRIIKERENSA